MPCPIAGAPHNEEEEDEDADEKFPFLIGVPAKRKVPPKVDILVQAQQVADWAPRLEVDAARKLYQNMSRTVWTRTHDAYDGMVDERVYKPEQYVDEVERIEWRMNQHLADTNLTTTGTGSGLQSTGKPTGAPSAPTVAPSKLHVPTSQAEMDSMGMLETMYAGQLQRFARTFTLIQNPVSEGVGGIARPLLENSLNAMEIIGEGLEAAVLEDRDWAMILAAAGGAALLTFGGALAYGKGRGKGGGSGLSKPGPDFISPGAPSGPIMNVVTEEESRPAEAPAVQRRENRRRMRSEFRRTVRSVVERNSRGNLQRRTTTRNSVSVSRI